MAVSAAVLGMAAPAGAIPGRTEIDRVAGRIWDVRPERILYLDATEPPRVLKIKNRLRETVSTLPPVPGEVRYGYLTPSGAILATEKRTWPYGEVYEWRDGALTRLGNIDGGTSMVAKGDYAIWNDGSNLYRRELRSGTTLQVASNAGNTSNDVAENGDVVYWDSSFRIYRYRNGVTQRLSGDSEFWDTHPVTDGAAVAYSRKSPCCGVETRTIVVYGPTGGEVILVEGWDYQVNGGWLAFTRGRFGEQGVWTRDPSGAETQMSFFLTSSWIVAVNPIGEVLLRNGDQLYLARKALPLLNLGQSNAGGWGRGGLSDWAAAMDGQWFEVAGGSLLRVSTSDDPTPGSYTSISSAPSGTTSSTTAHFSFASSQPNSTFQCNLDGRGWESCFSRTTYPALTDGAHSLLARSVAADGAMEANPASQTWTVDTVPPTVTLEASQGAITQDPRPTFSGSAGTSSGDSETVTVKVFSGGTTSGTPVQRLSATRTKNGFSATAADPLADGTYTAQAEQSDAAGNVGSSPAKTFKVDTTPPEPLTLKGPPEDAANLPPRATFSWTSTSDATSGMDRYELWIDDAKDSEIPASDCSRDTCPQTSTASLATGPHRWHVRAYDVAGNEHRSKTRSFTVDATPPGGFSLVAPAAGAKLAEARPKCVWDASTDAGSGLSHYEIWLDGAAEYVPVGTTEFVPASRLSDGSHSWHVVAVDQVGNKTKTPVREFTVDTTGPETSITQGPPETSRASVATFEFISAESLVTFECALDGSAWKPCSSPASYSSLAHGPHKFRVRALDSLGNADPTPAEREWAVDTQTPPSARLSVSPNPALTGQRVFFDASDSTDPLDGRVTRYEWDLDGDGSFETDTGEVSTTTATYSERGTVASKVKVANNVGATDVAGVAVDVRLAPPEGRLGASINNGARFTNDPLVKLSVIWPPLADKVLLSNDGGFRGARTFAITPVVDWTLDSSGPERLPKTVYLRFLGGESGRETYQDDIILDETIPQVLSATLLPGTSRTITARRQRRAPPRYRLLVRARDNASGILRYQVASNRRKPRRASRVRTRGLVLQKTISIGSHTKRLSIRVQDAAGNWSRWKRVREARRRR